MFDKTLINKLKILAKKEKIAKSFARRLRVKGTLTAKSDTKNGNLRITVTKDQIKYNLIIPKTHKERYLLAQSLPINSFVSVEATRSKFMNICVKIKILDSIDESKQSKLE